MKGVRYLSVTCLALLVAVGAGVTVLDRNVEAQGAPAYRNIPLWPRPFPDDSWVIGSVTGVATDAQNNVWVVHRGADSLESNEKGMVLAQPSSSVCCMPAPPVLKYDPSGKLIASLYTRSSATCSSLTVGKTKVTTPGPASGETLAEPISAATPE